MSENPTSALAPALIVKEDLREQQRLRRLLSEAAGQEARIDAAGTLRDAGQLLTRCDHYAMALVDTHLPDGCGIEFIGWLCRARPSLKVVAFSKAEEVSTALAALRNGASGYLLEQSEDIELAMHLRCLHRGGVVIDPVIVRRLLSLLPQAGQEPVTDTQLSVREAEILRLVARGLSNREIAHNVGLSRLTIETHTRNIYRKLEVRSRTAAVFKAQILGLLF